MNSTIKTFVLLAALAACGVANAQMFGFGSQDREMSANRYGQGNALKAGQAFEAEILSTRAVKIRPSTNLANAGAGGVVGGSVGALAASQIHGGQDKWVLTSALTALGGVLGAVAGSPSEVDAQEIVIKNQNSGGMLVVTQAGTDLKTGDRVIVTEVGGEVRVSKR